MIKGKLVSVRPAPTKINVKRAVSACHNSLGGEAHLNNASQLMALSPWCKQKQMWHLENRL